MTETRYCRQCGKPFKATREDHFFCEPKCVAAWYRDNPNPDFIHEEKPHVHTYQCEQCGGFYQVNDYAKRSGQREPKYCSVKCKQKAYRQRTKGTQQQADRRHGGAAGNAGDTGPKSGGKGSKSSGNTNQGQNTNGGQKQRSSGKTASGGTSDFWAGYSDKFTAAYDILGCHRGATNAEVKRAWMKMLKKFHPDVCADSDATIKTQKINWAYEYLTK